jgi:hypothetical protein
MEGLLIRNKQIAPHTKSDNKISAPKLHNLKLNKIKEVDMLNKHSLRTYENRYINHAPELDECKSRKRRWPEFLKESSLNEVLDLTSVKHANIVDIVKLSGCGMNDHCTYLKDGFKAIVLMEPYHVDLDKFPHDKLVYIKVPGRIAPYCGGILFDDNGNAISGTESYLVTTKINERYLKEIEQKLIEAASKLPPFDYFDEE